PMLAPPKARRRHRIIVRRRAALGPHLTAVIGTPLFQQSLTTGGDKLSCSADATALTRLAGMLGLRLRNAAEILSKCLVAACSALYHSRALRAHSQFSPDFGKGHPSPDMALYV